MLIRNIGFLLFSVVSLLFAIGAPATARAAPRWARFSYFLFGAVGVAWGILKFFLEYHRSTLPYSTRLYLDHYITLLAGIAVGVFTVLAISGQFTPDRLPSMFRRSDKNSVPKPHGEV